MVEAPPTDPKANMPTVALPAAEPDCEAALAAAPDDTTQPEYVYLSRVVELLPKLNIPTVELPAAEPDCEAALAAVAVALTQLENVYLLRVVEATVVYPNANIPTVP